MSGDEKDRRREDRQYVELVTTDGFVNEAGHELFFAFVSDRVVRVM